MKAGTGRATYYGDPQDNEPSPSLKTPGACGYEHIPPNPNYFVAINKQQYNREWCGKCVDVICDDSKCVEGARSISYIADMCPGCSYGQIDLSINTFADVMGSIEKSKFHGIMNVKWRVIECPGFFGPVNRSMSIDARIGKTNQQVIFSLSESTPTDFGGLVAVVIVLILLISLLVIASIHVRKKKQH